MAKFVLDALGVQLSGNKVCWDTHSQNFARIIVQVGSMIEEFQELGLDIFLFSSNRHIYLDVVWFLWDQNSKVDILKEIADFDDCSVDHEVFSHLDGLWGPNTIEIFACCVGARIWIFFVILGSCLVLVSRN